MSGALKEKPEKTARKGKPPRLDVIDPPRLEAESIVKQVQDVLDALEVHQIASEARRTLQRLLYRRDKYLGDGGRGEIILLLRCILESNGNGNDALIEPIVGAVAGCLKPEFTNRCGSQQACRHSWAGAAEAGARPGQTQDPEGAPQAAGGRCAGAYGGVAPSQSQSIKKRGIEMP